MHQQQPSSQSTNSDHNLSELRKQIALSSAIMIELVSHNERFTEKLKTLNESGVQYIVNQDYHSALVFLQEAEKVLQYAASCGKTIDRVLIISTLQNQACAYQRIWDLQKASNYLEAIIYNMNAYIQCVPEIKIDSEICDPMSNSYLVFSNFVRKKINVAFYYLQFSAVSSQIKKHDTALGSAFKALSVLKNICEECYNYQKFIRKDEKAQQGPRLILRDLSCLKDTVELDKLDKYISLAQKGIRKLKSKIQQGKFSQDKTLSELSKFAISQVMQISPINPNIQQSQPSMREQVNYVHKIYKALYISICFFAIATELRLISFDNYIQQKRMSSIQFRKSQLYHLNAIILASKYVPCQTRYLEHIVKSFSNHYKIDLLQYNILSENSDQQTEKFHKSVKNPMNIQINDEANLIKSTSMQKTKINTFNSEKSIEHLKPTNRSNSRNENNNNIHKKSPKSKNIQQIQHLQHLQGTEHEDEKTKKKNEQKKFLEIPKKSLDRILKLTSKNKNGYCSVNEFGSKKSLLVQHKHSGKQSKDKEIRGDSHGHCKDIFSPINRYQNSKEASKDYGKDHKKYKVNSKSKSKSKSKGKISREKSRERSDHKLHENKKKKNKLHQQYFIQEKTRKKKSKISNNGNSSKSQHKSGVNTQRNHKNDKIVAISNQRLFTTGDEYMSMPKQFRKQTIMIGEKVYRTSSKINKIQ